MIMISNVIWEACDENQILSMNNKANIKIFNSTITDEIAA